MLRSPRAPRVGRTVQPTAALEASVRQFEPRRRHCPFLSGFHNMFDELKNEDPDLNPFAFAILKRSAEVLAVAKIEYFEIQNATAEVGIGKYASIAYICGKGSGSGTKLTQTLIDLHRKRDFIVRVASLDGAKGYWRGFKGRREYSPREVVTPSLHVQGREDSKFYWTRHATLTNGLFV